MPGQLCSLPQGRYPLSQELVKHRLHALPTITDKHNHKAPARASVCSVMSNRVVVMAMKICKSSASGDWYTADHDAVPSHAPKDHLPRMSAQAHRTSRRNGPPKTPCLCPAAREISRCVTQLDWRQDIDACVTIACRTDMRQSKSTIMSTAMAEHCWRSCRSRHAHHQYSAPAG